MIFTIDIWVLWAIGLGVGVPIVAIIIFFAIIGYSAMNCFKR